MFFFSFKGWMRLVDSWNLLNVIFMSMFFNESRTKKCRMFQILPATSNSSHFLCREKIVTSSEGRVCVCREIAFEIINEIDMIVYFQ